MKKKENIAATSDAMYDLMLDFFRKLALLSLSEKETLILLSFMVGKVINSSIEGEVDINYQKIWFNELLDESIKVIKNEKCYF